MVRRSGKKKNVMPLLPDEADLGVVFGVKVDFADEVEVNLAGMDLDQVLVEKRGGTVRPQTLLERVASYPPSQEELDLHGCTADEAARKTSAFINGSLALRLKTVLIITGKGLHSEGPAVLPLVVDGCLEELKTAGRILHYSWGEKGRGRSGAVVVFLN